MSNRRDFIKRGMQSAAAAAAAAALPAGASHRHSIVDGTCESPPMIGKLLISRSGLPAEFWDANSRVATIIAQAHSESDSASKLLSDLPGFMNSAGFNIGSSAVTDETISLLAVAVDPDFSKFMQNGDYSSAFLLLEASGLSTGFKPDSLSSRIEVALKSKSEEIENIIAASRASGTTSELLHRLATTSGGNISPEDLAVVKDIFASNLSTRSQEAVVALSIAALYVTVAAYVVLWVAVGAWVFTSGPDDESNNNQRASRQRESRISRLDPDLMQDYERTLKIASLTGDEGIAREGILRLLRAESTAIISALRTCGYLSGSPSNDEELVDVATQYAARAAGVSK